jgi:hypothetical protein
MSYGAVEVGSPTTSVKVSDLSVRTRPSVQVLSLLVCAAASGTTVAAAHLPWFGSPSDGSVPEYSAVSGQLWRTGLAPGAQSWGYLLVSWSALLAVSALLAALACVLLRLRSQRRVGRLLMCIGVASLLLVALVLAELTTSAQFDLDSYAHLDWGAWTGLSLTVVSSVGAWFAWATWRFPHLWGLDASAE